MADLRAAGLLEQEQAAAEAPRSAAVKPRIKHLRSKRIAAELVKDPVLGVFALKTPAKSHRKSLIKRKSVAELQPTERPVKEKA